MDRRAFLAAVGGAAASLSGCLGESGSPLPTRPTGTWRQAGHDARNTASADVPVPTRGAAAWTRGPGGVAAPLVADGTVYSVARDAAALDARTGERRWRVELPGRAEHAPALGDDRLFVATEERVLALDREDGSERWAESLPRSAGDPPTLGGDPAVLTVPLVARRNAAGLLAYDPASGERRWENSTIRARRPAIDGERVYTTGYRSDGDTGVLRALSAADGSRRWERELASPDTPPVVADDGILVGSTGTLRTYDPAGEERRSLAVGDGRLDEPPAVDGGLAVVGAGGETIAVDLAAGEIRWRVDVGVASGLALGREAVVVGAETLSEETGPGVAVLDRTDGRVRWEYDLGGFDSVVSTPPTLADGGVYVVTNREASVLALGDVSGES